ncbi:hypothetical protein PYV02_01525 [Leifsonia sp. H3M29-4]|uniref:hypothetical protein n=1 Tax=Salinibacterium metalliresistens TaxID=3031321 RepID=UPI0023DA0241|nr:hypothetical protein [Salinibacterium metalliresistens]MDF1477759.1 hypothetical protein [Salinibacterium metalliresistens]
MIDKRVFTTKGAVALAAASSVCALMVVTAAVLPQPKQPISVAEQREFDRLLWNVQSIIEAYPRDLETDSIDQIKAEAALLETALVRAEGEPALLDRINALFGDQSDATARQAESSAENTLTAALEFFERADALRRSVEEQYPHAGIQAVKTLRNTAELLGNQRDIDSSAVSAVNAFADAVEWMRASDDERQYPVGDLRGAQKLEIEAFARELAGENLLLEVEFVPSLGGRNEVNPGWAGYTMWNWVAPGEAVIFLTESVAASWPTETMKSLMAHEVGHVVGTVCAQHFDLVNQDEVELFATAWAISQGFTDEWGNGVNVYQRPTHEYVAAVGTCEF